MYLYPFLLTLQKGPTIDNAKNPVIKTVKNGVKNISNTSGTFF
jgi:hypothetical protein